MTFLRGLLVGLVLAAFAMLSACDRAAAPSRAKSIAQEYPAEVTALATEGGKGLPFIVGKDLRPVWETKGAPPVRSLLPFRMTDQRGKDVALEDLKGKVAVVSFFYSECPGICPATTRNLKAVQDKYLGDDRVVMLSFSITPEHDTPVELRKFAKTHRIDSRRWHLMTGARKDLYELARESFGADTFSPKDDAAKKLKPEDFLHSENVYLLDSDHKLRGIYQGLVVSSVQELTRDVGTLLR